MSAFLGAIQYKSWFNPLTTDDTFGVIGFWLHVISWHNPQGEVGGCTALADSAWRWLQLPVEKPWSIPGRPFVCFLAKMGVENALSPCRDSISG